MVRLKKCEPWSLIIVLGTPNLEKMLDNEKVETMEEQLGLLGISSTH